jgi:cbb3-type cytochrome oxidase maturation protein
MGLVPLLVLAALTLSALGLALFFWAVSGGQFDDLEHEAVRALHEGPPLGAARPPPRSDDEVPKT